MSLLAPSGLTRCLPSSTPNGRNPRGKMEDGTPRDVIQARFDELVALQDAISAEKHAAFWET